MKPKRSRSRPQQFCALIQETSLVTIYILYNPQQVYALIYASRTNTVNIQDTPRLFEVFCSTQSLDCTFNLHKILCKIFLNNLDFKHN